MNQQLIIWKYFLLTIVTELPVVAVWMHNEWKKAVEISFWLNLFTWPLLVTLATNVGWNIPAMEFAVAVTEGCGYRIFFKQSWLSSMTLSFLVNGLSYALGLFI